MDTIDAALDRLGDYTLGLNKYPPIRSVIRRMPNSYPVLTTLDHAITVHIATIDKAALDKHLTPPVETQRRCDEITPNPLLMRLCHHAYSQSIILGMPTIWADFRDLIDEVHSQMTLGEAKPTE